MLLRKSISWRSHAKWVVTKEVLETVFVTSDVANQPTVVSSAVGEEEFYALEMLSKLLSERDNYAPWIFP